MKRRYIILGLALLLMVVLLAALAGPATGKATQIAFSLTRTQTFEGDPSRTVGTKMTFHLWDRVFTHTDASVDPAGLAYLLEGTTEYVDSFSVNPGNQWLVQGHGTYTTESADGTTLWEGTYTSKLGVDADGNIHLYVKGEGRGVSETAADGLFVKWTAEALNFGPVQMVEGYIIEK